MDADDGGGDIGELAGGLVFDGESDDLADGSFVAIKTEGGGVTGAEGELEIRRVYAGASAGGEVDIDIVAGELVDVDFEFLFGFLAGDVLYGDGTRGADTTFYHAGDGFYFF